MSDFLSRIEKLSPRRLALLAMQLQARLEASASDSSEPIAIVGIGCRLPGGANSPEAFWQLMCEGVDAVTEVPSSRWELDALYDADPDAPGKVATRWGGFVDNVDRFDAGFFRIAPREAVSIDPQQRFLLETSWEALEDAGEASEDLAGSLTGVFIGISGSDYPRVLSGGDVSRFDTYSATGLTLSVASGRLSYALGLQGPSISVDTACSSSLVSVHLAVQSLRRRESNLALAGGVHLMLSPESTIMLSRSRMMASDGRCKTFDESGDGYVRGEGCAMVVLKRLSDALADGNPIYAVIRGSAVNQDGRSNGLTAPNGPSQEAVIRAALADARVNPEDVAFVETHGTGTALGDPIEVHALGSALGAGRDQNRPLYLGAVKTNIGHLEAVAGITGLIKAALVVKHGRIPGNLHLRKRNPHIDWDNLPVELPTELTDWPATGSRRFAGTSSFGFSGTNAHVILEQPPEMEAPANSDDGDRPVHVLLLSGKNRDVVKELAARYYDRIERDPEMSAADVCFTTHVGRKHFEERLAIPVRSREEVLAALRSVSHDELPAGSSRARADLGLEPPRVAFLCPGQGSQYAGMARGLFQTEPAFREAFASCAALFDTHLDRKIADLILAEDVSHASELLNDTRYSQPALFTISWALAQLWRQWGVKPYAVLGHSLGEFAAACIAGVYSLEDGVKLVAERGRLMSSLPVPGGMASFAASEDRLVRAMEAYGDRLSIAAVNGPESVVVSGETDALKELVSGMAREGVRTKILDVSFAGHSHLVEPVLDEFENVAATIAHKTPSIKLISNLTAQPIDRPDGGWAQYWRRHARHTVRFADGIRTLGDLGCSVFIELGPHTTVTALGRQVLGDERATWLPSLRRDMDDCLQIAETIGKGYVRGMNFDWKAYHGARSRHLVSLPTYPFQRERYWPDSTPAPSFGKRPRWESVVHRGHWQAEQTPIDVNLPAYLETMSTLNGVAGEYIRKTLREAGVFVISGETRSLADVAAGLGVVPGYHKLLTRWLRRLVREGDLEEGEPLVFTSPEPLRPEKVDEAVAVSLDAFGNDRVLTNYLQQCGEQLPAILKGERNPVEILFEGGRTETSSNLYETGPMIRYFNNISRAIVEGLIWSQPSGRPLRILEIGAGTGGTTSALLPVLPDDTYYAFTDVSNFFLDRAQERFKQYRFVRYGILNAEKDPAEQGYQTESFDLVVAANVIHATANIDRALQHAKSLLAPGGLLLLFETTGHPDWFDISIGLIEGWNLHEDPRRKEHPLLDRAAWEETLTDNGFDAVQVFPENPALEPSLFNAVVVARTPGSPDSARRFMPAEASSHEGESVVEEAPAQSDSFLKELREALPIERHERLVWRVRERIARVLRLPGPTAVDPNARLLDLGLDSLMAIDLRNVLAEDLGIDYSLIPATLIFDCPTADAVAQFLIPFLDLDQDVSSTEYTGAPQDSTTSALKRDATDEADLEEYDEAELEALLARKLDTLEANHSLAKLRENE